MVQVQYTSIIFAFLHYLHLVHNIHLVHYACSLCAFGILCTQCAAIMLVHLTVIFLKP